MDFHHAFLTIIYICCAILNIYSKFIPNIGETSSYYDDFLSFYWKKHVKPYVNSKRKISQAPNFLYLIFLFKYIL